MSNSTTKLGLYNAAILLCRDRLLSSLTDNVEPRYLLDSVWDDGGVDACLERGQWNFAMRTVSLDYDPSFAPGFGYRFAFGKPADWILTSAVGEEEYFRVPLTRYFDEAGFWYADLQTIFVRYVSNDAAYGANMAMWPESFYEFVVSYFASKIVGKTTGSDEQVEKMEKIMAKRLLIAKSRAAMADPTRFVAQGAWSRSRQRFLNRRDGGNQGNLIG